MAALFDRYYSAFIFWVIIVAVWFAALFGAAHNIWAASLLFGLITVLGLIFCIGRCRDRRPVRFPLIGSLTLLLLAFRLSLWQSCDVETSWLDLWGWSFTLLLFYLFINVVESDRDVERFFGAAGAVVIPLLVYCLWQRFGPPQILPEGQKPTVGLFGYGYLDVPLSWLAPGKTWHLRYGHWEIHASLINSVVLAGFVLYWTLLYWMKGLKDRRWMGLWLACMAVLIFARSWWAFIALGAGAAVYYRRELGSFAAAHKKWTALAFSFLLGFLALVIYVKTHHGIERAADAAYYHANSRWYYWQAALHMFQRFPWTGVGLGGFATAFPHFKIGQVENTLFAHGVIPQMAAETGLLGLLALAGVAGHYFWLRHTTPVRRSPLLRVLDATLIAVLFFTLLSINMDFLLNKFCFVLILGATLASRPLRSYPVRPLWYGTAAASLVLLVPLWLSLFTASRLYAAGMQRERQGDVLQAIKLFQDAVEVEPFHADSYWQLSRLYAAAYKRTHNPDELAGARMYLKQALRYKKDVRYVKDLENLK